MTPDERTLLTQFLNDLGQARPATTDPEAAQMIASAIRSNPDSAYVLVQHALMADQALHQAQARIAELQAQGAAAQPAPSFLGGAFAPRSAPAPSGWAPAAPAQTPWAAAAAPPPPPPPSGPFGLGGGPLSGGGGLGNFLRSAGTTAAGVAGGEMLFSGLSNIFGGHHGGGGFGGGFGGEPVENVTINNYGGDDGDDGDDDTSGDDYS